MTIKIRLLSVRAVLMAPPNMAGTATNDTVARWAMPLIPWPLVHPQTRSTNWTRSLIFLVLSTGAELHLIFSLVASSAARMEEWNDDVNPASDLESSDLLLGCG
jgi:hypothetical protein